MQYPSSYGRYTLLESIGKGGMSAIDLAQQSVSDAQYLRFVVIKRMQAQLTEQENFVLMFKDEARINAELQHNKIAQVYEFGQCEDEYFIAMEYIPGVDLRVLQKELAKQAKGLPIRITLRILADVCEALDYAHTRLDTYGRQMNVVHRDVNPRNIMISIRGEVKLIDFGVAKADNRLDKTVGHTLKGKFAYMSPEQIEGKMVDGRADLFAVGLTLHELVDGRRPFVGLNEVQIMHRILSGNIPTLMGPKDHPQPELVQAIHECSLSTDAKGRYPTAGHMREAFEHAAKPIGGLANNSEMAEFLRDIMPSETASIAYRLDKYRKESTQPNGLDDPLDLSLSQDVPTELLLKTGNQDTVAFNRNRSSNLESTLVNPQTNSNRNNRDILIMAGIGLILFLFGAIWLYQRGEVKPPSPLVQEQNISNPIEEPKPTTQDNSPLPTIENQPKIIPVTQEATEVNTVSPPPSGIQTQPNTAENIQSTPSTPPPTESQQTVQVPQEQSPAQTDTQPPAETQEAVEANTQANTQENAQENAQENQQLAPVEPPPSEPIEAVEPVETTENQPDPAEVVPPTEQVPVEEAYIFLTGSQSGLTVTMDEQSIGTLNGNLRQKVPIGVHTFLVYNPQTGREFKQTITVSKSTPNLIRVPEL
jgi:serine/threonine protein kinase